MIVSRVILPGNIDDRQRGFSPGMRRARGSLIDYSVMAVEVKAIRRHALIDQPLDDGDLLAASEFNDFGLPPSDGKHWRENENRLSPNN
jgi:hypothetical protein